MADNVQGLAADIKPEGQSAVLRIGVITEIEPVTRRVKMSTTGEAWLVSDVETTLKIGDRVYAIQQGSTAVVAGRLAGFFPIGYAPVGAILLYAGLSYPNGWIRCDGSYLDTDQYPELFATLGYTYGSRTGDFRIPDLRGRFPIGAGAEILGTSGGARTVALTEAQMPSHSHSYTVAEAGAIKAVTGGTGNYAYVYDSRATGGAGSGSAHENMPPWQAVHYIIRTF